MSSVHKPAATAAGGGFLAGLAAILLPLLQGTPGHLAPGVASTSIGSGAVLAVGSVLGFLYHHSVISKAELTTAGSFVASHQAELEQVIARQPFVEKGVLEAKQLATNAKNTAIEVEAKIPNGPLVAADIEGAAKDAAEGVVSKYFAGKTLVTTSDFIQFPAKDAPADAEVQAVPAVPVPAITHALAPQV